MTTEKATDAENQQKKNLISYFEEAQYTTLSRKDKMAFNNNSRFNDFVMALRALNASDDSNYATTHLDDFKQHLERLTDSQESTWRGKDGKSGYDNKKIEHLIHFTAQGLQLFEDSTLLPPSEIDTNIDSRQLLQFLISNGLTSYDREKHPLNSILSLSREWLVSDADVRNDFRQWGYENTLQMPTEELKLAMHHLATGLNYPTPDEAYGYERESTNQFFNQVVEKLATLKASDKAAYNLVVERLDGDFPDLKFAEKVQALGTTPSGASVMPSTIQTNILEAPHIA